MKNCSCFLNWQQNWICGDFLLKNMIFSLTLYDVLCTAPAQNDRKSLNLKIHFTSTARWQACVFPNKKILKQSLRSLIRNYFLCVYPNSICKITKTKQEIHNKQKMIATKSSSHLHQQPSLYTFWLQLGFLANFVPLIRILFLCFSFFSVCWRQCRSSRFCRLLKLVRGKKSIKKKKQEKNNKNVRRSEWSLRDHHNSEGLSESKRGQEVVVEVRDANVFRQL